jgi:hypothetical protein
MDTITDTKNIELHHAVAVVITCVISVPVPFLFFWKFS